MNKPNLTWLELDITYKCNLRCHNCNRMTQLVAGQEADDLQLDHIHQLIEESERLKYPYRSFGPPYLVAFWRFPPIYSGVIF